MKYKNLIDKIIPFVVIILLLFSCSSTQNSKTDLKCEDHYKNDFNGISTVKNTEIINNDTITYYEVRYLCTHISFYLKKTMFDEYGIWDDLVRKDNGQVIAIWEDIDLLSDGNLYNIYASSWESTTEIYSSVMVLDEKNIDQLNPTSPVKNKLVLHFGNMIKNNNEENRDFYETYWKTVNLERWAKNLKFIKQINR